MVKTGYPDVWQYEHRAVAEGVLGRSLLDTEDVHHKDGNTLNNDPENLEVLDHGAHKQLHLREVRRAGQE
jgi:HNH endonuclease